MKRERGKGKSKVWGRVEERGLGKKTGSRDRGEERVRYESRG